MSAQTSAKNILGQELPQGELFHYTSMDGLKGMVAGKALWASNIEFLNDSTEFKHGEKVLKDVVTTRKRSVRGDRRCFFDELDKYPCFFQVEDVFLVSLTEEGDLLSQWRGYTPSGSGFSIGLDRKSVV